MSNAATSPNIVTEAFYAGALRRIELCMKVLSPILIVAAWLIYGWRTALGLGCGCMIAFLNFHWLERTVSALCQRGITNEARQPTTGIVFRFLLRYGLMALSAYVILTVSLASLSGLLAGFFLPVPAILCEAAYEVYAATRRGL